MPPLSCCWVPTFFTCSTLEQPTHNNKIATQIVSTISWLIILHMENHRFSATNSVIESTFLQVSLPLTWIDLVVVLKAVLKLRLHLQKQLVVDYRCSSNEVESNKICFTLFKMLAVKTSRSVYYFENFQPDQPLGTNLISWNLLSLENFLSWSQMAQCNSL